MCCDPCVRLLHLTGVLPPGPNPFLAKVHELWAPILPDNNENKETFLVGGYHYRHVRKRLIVVM